MSSIKYVFTSDSDDDEPQPLSRPQFSCDSSDSFDFDLRQPISRSKCSSDSSNSDSDAKVEQLLSQSRCSSDSPDQPLSQPKSSSDLQFSMKPSNTSNASPPHNWSEEEQIILLKGLIDFYSHQEKLNVRLDPSIFDDYILKKLNHLQLCQINEGIAKLTLKFMATMDNEKPPPEDDLVFQLSKQFWGTQYYIYQRMKNPPTYPEEEVDLHSKYPMLAVYFHDYYLTIIQRNIKLIPEEKLRKIDKKLDKLQSQEDHVRQKFIWDNYRWLRQLNKK